MFRLATAIIFRLANAIISHLANAIIFRLATAIIFRLETPKSRLETGLGQQRVFFILVQHMLLLTKYGRVRFSHLKRTSLLA